MSKALVGLLILYAFILGFGDMTVVMFAIIVGLVGVAGYEWTR